MIMGMEQMDAQLKNVKMVFSDIDGTLLDSQFRLSEKTIGTVGLLAQKKIEFVLVSARMQATMEPLHSALGLDSPMICYSGALAVDGDGEMLFEYVIEGNIALDIYRFIRGAFPQVTCSAYYGNDWIVRDINDKNVVREIEIVGLQPEQTDVQAYIAENGKLHKLFCVGTDSDIEAVYRALNARFGEDVYVCKSKDIYIEITAKSATKENAVKQLCERLDVPLGCTMAIGDHHNDIEMIREAGVGAAVGNAAEEVKAVAGMVVVGMRERGRHDG